MDLTIREYRDEDFAAVCALERENSPNGCKPEVFVRQAGVLFASTFLVAEWDGEVVGYTIGALVQHRPTTGWIVRLAVAEPCQRRGIGESLIATAVARLRERGVYEVCLSVALENHAARALYKKHGFLETDFCPAYFGEGGDRCILRRDLTGREDLICSD